MQEPNYEQAFLTQLEVYSKMFGVRWVVNLCHTFIMNSLAPPPRPLTPPPSPIFDVKIETDSLNSEPIPFLPAVEEATLSAPSPPPTPPPPEPQIKVLRLKKPVPLHSPTPSSPEAKQSLTETVKKTTTVKKRAPVRDLEKLVKSGVLPIGTKVVPADTEIHPETFGTIVMSASGKPGIQPSWNQTICFVGKANAPTQFLAAVNKQFPSHKVYGRQNAWNDLLKVNPTGGYVSLADLWLLQSR